MLKISTVSLILLFCCIAHALRSSKTHTQDLKNDFCWKDSYGRGVGTIPNGCPSGYEMLGVLCYEACPSGYQRQGLDCHQQCPSNWSDQGLFCRLSEYGRGAGYPWKFGDSLNDKGMKRRCQNENGQGNCEKWGLIFYPKCKDGYSNFACCICRPRTPNCNALGFNGGIDLSCAKRLKIGEPSSPSCNSDTENDAGLCYERCKSGYYGVGPVCWSKVPNGWTDCGMGAAKDKSTCGSITSGQIMSVGTLALNVATLGASSGATTAAKASSNSKLVKLFKQLQEKTKDSRDTLKILNLIRKKQNADQKLEEMIDANPDSVSEADIVRMTAEFSALVDPTGVAGVVATYSYRKCSTINF